MTFLLTGKSAKLFFWVCLTVLVLILAADEVGMGEDPASDDNIYVEAVDVRDHDAMINWAKGICRGVSIDEAAQSENVGPNVSEIVNALTKSLPIGMSDETLREVIGICKSELEEFEKRSLEIATILIDELAVDTSDSSIKTYKTGAEEILRHMMAKESEQQLIITVLRVVAELSQMEIDRSKAQIIVERVIAAYK